MSSRSEPRGSGPTLRHRSERATFGALPLDIQEQAAARVSVLPLLAAVMFLVAIGLLTTVSGTTTRDFHHLEVCLGGLAACAGFALFLRLRPLRPRSTIEAGLWFQAAVALAIAWLEMPRFVITADTAAGISGLCVWQLLFPALIPIPTWKTLVSSTGTTLMLPAVSKSLVLLGVPVDQAAVWVTTMPVAVCGVLGAVIGGVVYDLGRSVGEARLMGSYKLVERFGAGGMGEVWRAEHRLLARPAAVKLIRPELLQREGEDPAVARARFEREARATAALKSPHTVELYDYGVGSDGSFFYVMELLDGLTLRDLVEDHGPQPPGRVIHLIRQAAASLQEAHLRGLVHRDVKPANILTCIQGTSPDFVKVLDFGLVKTFAAPGTLTSVGTSITSSSPVLSGIESAPDATLAGTLRGTPETMAPETIRGRPVDHRADIYALGCIAYWLLSGHRVFSGNAMAVLWGHREIDPPRMADQLGAPVPADLEAVIVRCLEKSPDARPQSASELSELLGACADSRAWTERDAARWWAERRPSATSGEQDPTLDHAAGLGPTVSIPHLDQELPP